MKLHALILLAWFMSVTFVTCHPDEVLDLPGLSNKPSFRHYSGYLNASSGRYLHYWFVESENDPANDPLILWMNGGPGCSSLGGLLTELGPFHVNKDGKTLYKNPYSWNKVANVIFLEAPAGVGFSYADDGQYATDDNQTANDNYLALQHFFIKFPQFKKNDLYIMGESYGGIYVPTLSLLVLNGAVGINLKGFAIGNGFLDLTEIGNSLVFYGYYHGVFGQTVLNNLTSKCCKDGIFAPSTCHFADSQSPECIKLALDLLIHVAYKSGLNIFNLYADCNPSESDSSLPDNKLPKSYNVNEQIAKGIRLPCLDSKNVSNWINQQSVRTALHIPSNLPNWKLCTEAVQDHYKMTYYSMKSQILTLLHSGRLRGLLYYGDIDMSFTFLGAHWFADDLQLKLISTYHEWKFENQVAGFVKEFEGLTFTTIKGAGHMAPQDKPGPAFQVISNFLSQKPF